MILWVLMVSLTHGQQTCAKYKCAKSGQLTTGVCLSRSEGTVYLAECTDYTNSYCPTSFTATSNSSCTTPPAKIGFAYPGEVCKQASDCKYGTCVNNYCFGQELLSDCQVNGECNPGYQCATSLNRCFQLFDVGDNGCETEFDCGYDLTCDKGRCVPYFSIKSDNWIFNCTDFQSEACESGQCLYGYCVDSGKTKDEYPRKCSTYTDCFSDEYESQGVKLYSNCSCGLNSEGQGYCNLFPGDKHYRDYIEIKKEWIGKGILSKCNTVRRFSKDCMISHYEKSFAYEFEYKMYKAQYFALIYGADSCVLKLMVPGYYKDYEEVHDWSVLASITTIFILF